MSNKIKDSSKDTLRKQRALLRLRMLAGFKAVPIVSIGEIPKTLTKFPFLQQSYWVADETDQDNSTSCYFTLGPKEVFSTHIHVDFCEEIQLITPGTKIEWVTEDGIFFHGYGDVFKVDKNVMHALVNLVDFSISFKVKWRPKMIGWQVDKIEMI